MTEQDTKSDPVTAKLGPKPEGFVEEPQLYPGGADSVQDQEKYGAIPDAPLIPDPVPETNPAVEDKAPDEITEADDKKQEPDVDSGTETESGNEEAHNPEEPPA
ncbi:hypothetical protein [Nocardioides pacificus]